jgi:hypothetical protein
MKIKDGFNLKSVCGEYVIVATGRKNVDFSRLVSLNESAATVWEAVVGKDFEIDDVVKVLLDNYEVDEATARQDAEKLMASWAEVGLI